MAVGRVNVGGGKRLDCLTVIKDCYDSARFPNLLAIGDGYLYTQETGNILQINSETMELENTLQIGHLIYFMVYGDGYLYAGVLNDQTSGNCFVYKIDSTMTIIAQAPQYEVLKTGATYGGGYLYVTGKLKNATAVKTQKILSSNMSVVAESSISWAGDVPVMAYSDEFLYVYDKQMNWITLLATETMVKQQNTISAANTIQIMYYEGYLYRSASTSWIYKIDPVTRTDVAQKAFPGPVRCFTIKGGYMYIIRTKTDLYAIDKYTTSNLTEDLKGILFGGPVQVTDIVHDGKYFYIASGSVRKIAERISIN